jgi:uncharacterized protein
MWQNSKDAAHNMYLLGIIDEFGIVCHPDREPFQFYGHFKNEMLTAVVFVGGKGGLVVPSAGALTDIVDIAKELTNKIQIQSSLGEKSLVDVLLQHVGGQPKYSKLQKIFSVTADDLGPFTNPMLRLATESDVTQLFSMAAEAQIELVQRDPRTEDNEGFMRRVHQRVKTKRTYVLEENGTLVFKLDVGGRSTSGAELEGLYTVPGERNKGHATLCLGQISRFLLSSLPRLTVRVDESASHFAGIARKVGYSPGRVQRLVWM